MQVLWDQKQFPAGNRVMGEGKKKKENPFDSEKTEKKQESGFPGQNAGADFDKEELNTAPEESADESLESGMDGAAGEKSGSGPGESRQTGSGGKTETSASEAGGAWKNDSEKVQGDSAHDDAPAAGADSDKEELNTAPEKSAGENPERSRGNEDAPETKPGKAQETECSGAESPDAGSGSPDSDIEILSEEENLEDGKNADRKKKRRRRLLLVLLIVIAALVAAYLITAYYFTNHFLPNTVINGIDASTMTVEEVQEALRNEVDAYEITIEERGGGTETISGTEIGLEMDFDDTLDTFLDEQGAFAWIANLSGTKTFDPEKLLHYDETLFATVLSSLACMDEEQMTVSEDAEILYSEDSETYEIEPAVFGTWMDSDAFSEAVGAAVLEMQETLDLEEAGLYADPAYTEDSEEITAACTELNERLEAEITYDMGDAGSVSVSRTEVSSWLKINEDMEVVFNEDAIAEFVADLASQYDTQYTTHSLTTTWGSTVSVSGGNYGWKIDQEAEIAQLEEDVLAKTAVTREPNYSSTAVSHTGNDYGSTYVEINLTAQHLYFYKNGSLIVSSDFVSGDVSDGNATPTGIYKLSYKEADAVLTGDDYETPVSYWMPFNGGVGMHDATWRSSFGGTIYKTNGSHGCINLPYSAAQTIFNNISAGDAVIVYELAGTEQSSSDSDDEDEEEEEGEEEEESGEAEEEEEDAEESSGEESEAE